MKAVHLILAFCLLFLSGCAGLPQFGNETGPSTTATQASGTGTSGNPPGTVDITPTPTGPVTLTIWLPPEFDPAADTAHGQLLRARLDDFLEKRRDLRIEVRVKAPDGPGGILDTLTTASAAAPLALPDLVAVPRPMLEASALKGLLHPYDGLSSALDDPDWFDYARQLSRVQNSTFGLPFAGDAVLLVYREDGERTPPPNWQAALDAGDAISFAAADPQSLFTLLQYQAAGGAVRDGEGRPYLDAESLETVLRLYREASQAGISPFWLTQLESDEQAWESFQDRRAPIVITWASTYLQNAPSDSSAAPVLTTNGEPFTITNGWVWAIASPQSEKQKHAAQLAEFLTESSFLAEWTAAAGYLPTRPTALENWDNPELVPLANQILSTAGIYPPADILTRTGPALEQATVEVLKQESSPAKSAQAAAEAVNTP